MRAESILWNSEVKSFFRNLHKKMIRIDYLAVKGECKSNLKEWLFTDFCRMLSPILYLGESR